MADEKLSLDKMVQKYNLTSEEMVSVQKRHETEAFTEDSLAKFVSEMRETNAITTSQKDARDISFDELQVAWETVKDAKEGDALKAKQTLQAKSEEIMQQVDPNITDMSTAPELSEWLNINNSLENPDNAARNQALGKRLDDYNKQFDAANGLAGISRENAEQISAASELLNKQYEGFDPFAVNDKGELIHPEFANVKDFYDKLTLLSDDGKGKIVPDDFNKDMSELARREAVTRLSTMPGFLDLPASEQTKIFADVYAGCMEEGAVSLIVAQATQNLSEEQKKNPQTIEMLEKEAAEKFRHISETNAIHINHSVALGAYAGRLQAQTNVEKRISQKTGKRGFWGKIKDKKKAFEQKHPKMAGALKFIGNIGLTMGVNMAFGGAGLAVLSAYKTYQAVKKANEERKAANEKSEQKQSLLKFLVKNPRHLISITSNIAGVALAGWSASMGLDANGLAGQAVNHGTEQALDNMSNAMSNFAGHFSVDNLKNSLGDGNIGHGWGEKFSNMFNTENTLRFSRTIRTLGVATANLGVDIAEIAKPENKGKRMKMFFKALGKAGLSSAAVFATTPVENAEAAPAAAAASVSGNGNDFVSPLQPETQEQQETMTMPWQKPLQEQQDPTIMPWQQEQQETVATAGSGNETVIENAASQKDLEFWENRTDKFLGEENKQYIYNMVEKGEIKLPEGIETKEEYAYKLAMDIQQTPAEINAAMGGEWNSSAALTNSIKSWSAEDFNKLNGSVDDFSDRGYHNGEITGGRSHIGSGHHGGAGHSDVEPINNMPEDTANHDIDIRAMTKETLIDTFEDFRGMVGDPADGASVESQLSEYDSLMAAGRYDEATAYMKHLYEASGIDKPFEESDLAKADFDYRNALSGRTNDPDLSYTEYASSLQDNAAPTEKPVDIRSMTKETLINTFEDFRGMVGDPADGSPVESQLAQYDALMADGKYNEATAYMKQLYEASGINKPFEESNLAKADFDYRNALGDRTNDPDVSYAEHASSLQDNTAPTEKPHDELFYQEQEREDAINKGLASEDNSAADTPNTLKEDESTIVSRYDPFDKAFYKAAPFSLDDAAKLQNGQIIFAKDELNNRFCMGKDDAGNAFRMTIGTNFSKTGTSIGTHVWIDVPKDHPHYYALKGYLLDCNNQSDQLRAEMDTENEKKGYITAIMQKIKNHDFQIVKPEDLNQQASDGNTPAQTQTGKTLTFGLRRSLGNTGR